MRAVALALPFSLAVMGAACQPATPIEQVNICDIPARAAELAGKTVAIDGWYASSGHMAEIGSGACKDVRLVPDFKEGTKTTFAPPLSDGQKSIEAGLQSGLWPDGQFHGRFRGIFRLKHGERFVWEPPSDYWMLEIDQVDGIKPGEAPFIDPVPPCDAECRAYGRKMGATYP